MFSRNEHTPNWIRLVEQQQRWPIGYQEEDAEKTTRAFQPRTRSLTKYFQYYVSVKQEYESIWEKHLASTNQTLPILQAYLEELKEMEDELLAKGFTKEELLIDWNNNPIYNCEFDCKVPYFPFKLGANRGDEYERNMEQQWQIPFDAMQEIEYMLEFDIEY